MVSLWDSRAELYFFRERDLSTLRRNAAIPSVRMWQLGSCSPLQGNSTPQKSRPIWRWHSSFVCRFQTTPKKNTRTFRRLSVKGNFLATKACIFNQYMWSGLVHDLHFVAHSSCTHNSHLLLKNQQFLVCTFLANRGIYPSPSPPRRRPLPRTSELGPPEPPTAWKINTKEENKMNISILSYTSNGKKLSIHFRR